MDAPVQRNEAAVVDIEFKNGQVRVVGTDRGITLVEVAQSTDDKEKLKANDKVNQEKNTYAN